MGKQRAQGFNYEWKIICLLSSLFIYISEKCAEPSEVLHRHTFRGHWPVCNHTYARLLHVYAGIVCSLSWLRFVDRAPRRHGVETKTRRQTGQTDWRRAPKCVSNASRWRCVVDLAADVAVTACCTRRLAGWSSPPPGPPAVAASGCSSPVKTRASARPSHRSVLSWSDAGASTREKWTQFASNLTKGKNNSSRWRLWISLTYEELYRFQR